MKVTWDPLLKSTGKHVNPGGPGSFGKKSPKLTGGKKHWIGQWWEALGSPDLKGIVTVQNRQSQSFGLGLHTNDPMIA